MPKLTAEEKAAKARVKMLETARGCNYKPKVATVFQLMIRAEFGADPREYVTAVVGGKLRQVRRYIGQVVCVTCGDVYKWKDPYRGINTGHFLGRGNSICFEPTNVAPQCVKCNKHQYGERGLFEIWVRHVYGTKEVDRLRRLKNQSRKFTNDELVDMMILYKRRLAAAVAIIEVAKS